MADLKINVTAPGLGTLVDQSAQVNKNLEQAAAASQRISTPVKVAAMPSGMGETKTARSIGAGAGTGSSASDFAAQAQGLGGLVHLYATFAANIYAASAAFNVLKEAMNTVHLLQGIEQLSAQSGKNLASLAGQLNNVTDSALTMKQSLTSVANASAMGMTNDQILKMGEVAKKASQALGWDMADAMDRLTKGIGKGRPQLLDELGIIVNANTIYADYARSVGKTANSLTDFEKKQSFANAALKQGLDKFSAIDIPTNPFNKLEAAATNTLQSILGLIDKGIGPIVKYLSESPTGLALAMAGIASILLKQAIPAIGAFRENAKRMAEEATATANIRSTAAKDAILGQATATRKAAELSAQAEQKILTDNLTKLQAIRDTTKIGKDTKSYAILQKAPQDVTDEDLKLLDKQVKMLATRNAVASKGYQDAIDNIVLSKNAYHDKEDAIKKETDAIAKSSGYFSTISQQQRIADKANQESRARNITSVWAENTATQGFFTATKQGWKDLGEARKTTEAEGKGLGTFQVAMAGIKGTVSSAVSALSTLASSMGNIGMIVSAVAAIYGIFDAWVSKATEEQDKFNSKITEGISAVKVAGDAMAYLATKSKNAISLDSVKAMSNAMDGLTSSIDGQVDSMEKWIKKAGWWDTTKDWVAGIFGKSNAQLLAKNMGMEIEAALKTLVFTPSLQQEAMIGLSELLHIKPEDLNNAKAIAEAIDKGMTSSDASVVAQAKSAQKFLDTIKQKDAASTAAAVAFADSLTVVDKEIDIITTKLQFKDGLGKLGLQIEDMGIKMGQAMLNPLKAFDTLLNMAQDPKLLGVLSAFGGAGSNSGLISQISALKELQDSTQKAVKAVETAEGARKALMDKGEYSDIRGSLDNRRATISSEGTITDTAVSKAKSELDTQMKAVIAQEEAIFLPLRDSFTKASTAMIDSALKYAVGMAQLSKDTTDLSFAQKAGLVTADKEREIKLKELAYKGQELENSFNLQIAIIDNTLSLEKSNALAAISNEKLSAPEREKAAKSYTALSASELVRKGQATVADVTGTGTTSAEDIKAINLPYLRAEQGKMAAEAQIGAERYAVNRTKALELELQISAVKQASLKIDQEVTTQSLAQLSFQERFAAGYSEELSNKRTILEITQAQQAYDVQQLQFADRRSVLNAVIQSKLSKAGKASFATKVADLAKEEQLSASKKQLVIDTARLGQSERSIAEVLLMQNHAADLRITAAQNYSNVLVAQNDLELTKLGYLKDQGKISENLYNFKAKELALNTLDAQAAIAKAQEAKTREEAALKLKVLEDRRKEASNAAEADMSKNPMNEYTTPEGAKAAGIAAGVAAANAAVSSDALTLAKDAVTEADKLAASQGKVRDIAKEKLIAEYAYRDVLKEQADLVANMTVLFGTMGGNITTAGKAMMDFTAQSSTNAEAIIQANIAASRTGDRTKVIELEKKANSDQLQGIISVTGAAKKMFSEKTVIYKALDAAEKTSAAIKLGTQLMEQAGTIKTWLMKLGIMQTEVVTTTAIEADRLAIIAAGEAEEIAIKASMQPAKVGVESPGILASFSSMGPWGYAIGAALIASLMAMAGGGGGGGPQINMTGLTSADRQKTQGTGQSYTAGVLGDTGGGVFGDSAAKSTAIVDSLAVMKANSIEGLDYDNKMLKALEKLADSVVGAAKSLYTIPGLRAGTGFGTAAGDTSTAGFGASIPVVGKLLGSIFGGGTSTSTAITSAGLQLQGSFTNVMNDVAGSISQYKDVLTSFHESGGWFGSDSNWQTFTTETKALQAQASTAISDIFKDANNLFLEIGKKTGTAATDIEQALSHIDVSMPIDLMNLTGQALVDELNAVIGAKLSDAASTIFAGFDQFKNFGEDYLATVVRVVDGSNKVDMALKSIGSSFNIIGKFDISEAMIKAAGGIQAFMDETAAFKDKFLTDAEKLAPVQKAVTDQLEALGLSSTLTRDQFKGLVLAQDLTTASGQAMYQSLMQLSPGFDTVTAAINAANDKLTNLDIAVYTELGAAETALQLTRQQELATLDKSLQPIQKYLNALKDETTLKAKIATAYKDQSTALTSTITGLKASIKTLTDYKTALTTSASSLLTPAEKYAAAESTMLETAALARQVINSASTPEEVAARDDAVSKLSSTSDAFLASSKDMFASSDRYAQDFSSVLNLLDATSGALVNQKTDAEKQQTALDASVSFLNLISTSTDTTATLLAQLVTLQTATEIARQAAADAGSSAAASAIAIPARANGGMASGLTLVGEHGPELANFASTARIYSNQATNDIFNTKELVAEIRSLRDEVAQLRADQKDQTGHLIAANYDANAKNADAVAESTDAAFADQAWKQRSQAKIA